MQAISELVNEGILYARIVTVSKKEHSKVIANETFNFMADELRSGTLEFSLILPPKFIPYGRFESMLV